MHAKLCGATDHITCASGDLAEVYYGANHPMKPHRMCMAHSLILGYGLHERMEVYVRPQALPFRPGFVLHRQRMLPYPSNLPLEDGPVVLLVARPFAAVAAMVRMSSSCGEPCSFGISAFDKVMKGSQRPRRLNRVELAQFHSEDYVEFLEKICPERLEVRLLCDGDVRWTCTSQ